jgi:hypothetical protein
LRAPTKSPRLYIPRLNMSTTKPKFWGSKK